jgi:hypothetical protein
VHFPLVGTGELVLFELRRSKLQVSAMGVVICCNEIEHLQARQLLPLETASVRHAVSYVCKWTNGARDLVAYRFGSPGGFLCLQVD